MCCSRRSLQHSKALTQSKGNDFQLITLILSHCLREVVKCTQTMCSECLSLSRASRFIDSAPTPCKAQDTPPTHTPHFTSADAPALSVCLWRSMKDLETRVNSPFLLLALEESYINFWGEPVVAATTDSPAQIEHGLSCFNPVTPFTLS